MNSNLPPLGKYSTTTIDRDALCRAFNVPPGFNDQQINFWLAKDQPGGMDNYQSPDTLDMDLLRRSLANGAGATVAQINESLATVAAVLDAKGGTSSPVVERQIKPPAIIGLSASALMLRNEVAARLRAAGY